MSENTMTSDQDVVESLRNLTTTVQDLCNIINPENPAKSRAGLKAKDALVNTLHEQINNGRPEKIMNWEKVELMSVDDIEKENKQFTKNYEDIWETIDESTPSETEAATQAYTSAFTRFPEIYRLLGWRGTAEDEEDALFDHPVLTESRHLLLESIFGIEAYQMSRFSESSERSRMLFEISRLPRLLLILVRIACRQIYIVSACGADKAIRERPFDAHAVVRVLALVARTLKGGHLASSLTMEKLLYNCYKRRVLIQPDVNDVETYTKQFDLIYDCMTALNFTRRFREIREPLCSLFYMRYKSDSVREFLGRINAHEDATVAINRFPELPLEESTDSTFHPELFSISYLQDFGGLNIEWTDCLDEHLKIYANRNVIRVFAHPTFFYNGIDLHRDKRDYMQSTYFELALTYALLFRPTSSSNLKRLKRYTTAGEEQQTPWHKNVTFSGHPIHRFTSPWGKQDDVDPRKVLDINPLQYPIKNILSESFFRCSLPPSIQVAFNIADPAAAVKGLSSSWDPRKLTSTSMQQILSTELASNYPEDLKFMILSITENDFLTTESFVRFPYFAPRLRKLKMYLDSRQPSTMRELWVDRRDYRKWLMFWGGGFLGGGVLVLMFAILLVQVLQVVSLSN